MNSYYLHKTSIIDEPETSLIGDNTKIWHFCHIMPNVKIGNNVIIGQNCFIGSNVVIGDNVKIQNNVSVYDGVIIEDDAFIGPSVVFTNVVRPRAYISQKDNFESTLVQKGATIGANATIVCGVVIGEYSFIGAGSVITKDVPHYGKMIGNPAVLKGYVCKCGTDLQTIYSRHFCPECKLNYDF